MSTEQIGAFVHHLMSGKDAELVATLLDKGDDLEAFTQACVEAGRQLGYHFEQADAMSFYEKTILPSMEAHAKGEVSDFELEFVAGGAPVRQKTKNVPFYYDVLPPGVGGKPVNAGTVLGFVTQFAHPSAPGRPGKKGK
jgi:hypothetical protein